MHLRPAPEAQRMTACGATGPHGLDVTSAAEQVTCRRCLAVLVRDGNPAGDIGKHDACLRAIGTGPVPTAEEVGEDLLRAIGPRRKG